MIDEGENGWLIPPGSPRAMAEAIAAAHQQPDAARQMGARARGRVESLHWDRQVALLEGHLHEHLDG